METFVKMNMFQYGGSANNTFSIISGSFVGSIDFYSISISDFLNNPTSPDFSSLICTLGSNNIMSNIDGLEESGEILFFILNDFECLLNTVINYYNDYSKGNTRFYIPKGLKTIEIPIPYYPSISGVLYTKVNSESSYISPLTDCFINEKVNNMENIDFDRLVQPLVITTM